MRVRKSIFFPIMRILTLFFVGLVVAIVVALSSVNLETLRGNLVGLLRDATGMNVEIDGAVSWRFSLRPRVELNQVRIANAEWAKHKYAFSAEKVDVTLNLVSLFRDRPTIQNVKIYDANICVEKNSNGEYSIRSMMATNKTATDKAQEIKSLYPVKNLGFGRIEVKNLTAHILDDYYSLAGFSVRSKNLKNEREYSGWVKAEEDVFPFIVSLSEYNVERKIYPVRVAISTGGNALIANVALEGTSRLPIDFVIKGDIAKPGAFGKILGVDWSGMPSVSLNVAGGLNHKKLSLRKSSIYLRNTEFDFSGEYDWSGVPNIKLNLESKYVSLVKLFPGDYDGQWIRPNRELNVFKDVPLFGDKLRDKNLDLHVALDSFVVYRDMDLQKTNVSLKLKDGAGRLVVQTNIGDGQIKLAGPVSVEEDGRIYAKIGGRGQEIVVGEILNQVHKTDFLSELPVNIDLYVEANGRNLSELMSTVTGPVQVYSVASGYAHSALVAYMYGTDFLTSLRHSVQDLFRSEKKYDQIKVSCMAFNAKLRDGRFETQNGFAVETNAINIRLAGSLDLGQEQMRLSLTTVPVRGLKLSLTGNVVNSIELTGSLAEPDIKISGAAVAGKVASATGIGLLLAPFTGGLSLVAGAGVGLIAGDLLENWLADDKPCRTAMERGAPVLYGDPEWMESPVGDLIDSVIN